MFRKSLLGSLLIGLSFQSLAIGDWEFSGFASIGAGSLGDDDVTYIDFSNDWDINSDTVLGLQAQVEISDRWSFITQVVANGYDYTDESAYKPSLEWFVFGYQINPNTQVRFGRFRSPHYVYSTTLEVGYTYQWARPSQNAYPLFLAPFKHVDGIDITHNMSWGDMDLGYQVFLGTTEGEYEGTQVEAEWSFGGNVVASWNQFSTRLSAQQLKLSIEYPGFSMLEDGYAGLAATTYAGQSNVQSAFTNITNSFDADNQKVNYLSLGFSWELGQWTLMSEILNFRSEDRNFANDADGYYISAAYQIDDVSPYIMIGEYHNRFSKDIENKVRASEALVPVGDNPNLDSLREITIATFDLFSVEQETITLGVRYDFHPQADIKFEVEYFNFLNGTYGNFYPDDPFAKGKNTHLTSIVIDVVF